MTASKTDWLEFYDIYDSIEVLKQKSPEWGERETKIKSINQIKSKDEDVRQSWKNIFKFRARMKTLHEQEKASKNSGYLAEDLDEVKKKLIKVYYEKHLNMHDATKETGFKYTLVVQLSKNDEDVSSAYSYGAAVRKRAQQSLYDKRSWRKKKAMRELG